VKLRDRDSDGDEKNRLEKEGISKGHSSQKESEQDVPSS
jgi:hypothetical protein